MQGLVEVLEILLEELTGPYIITSAAYNVFNLAAVINHSGNLISGYYTYLVKDGETWWHCNDKAVVSKFG